MQLSLLVDIYFVESLITFSVKRPGSSLQKGLRTNSDIQALSYVTIEGGITCNYQAITGGVLRAP